MILTYSGRSKVSVHKIVDALRDMGYEAEARRQRSGDVNWGRSRADTGLNADISVCTNKRRMRELFASHDVPMPELFTAPEIEKLMRLQVGPQTFIGCPDQHTQGRGLWRVYDYRSLDRALKGTRRKQAATHFMAYIEDDAEYRVHVFRGKSIRVSKKIFTEDGGYTTGKPDCDDETRKRLRDAAKRAMEAVELDFGAVDILVKDGQPYVLEVNSAPGVGGSMPAVYARAFANWYEEQA